MNALSQLESAAAQALDKLEWPDAEMMLSYFAKLLNNPGSCIAAIIEALAADGPRVDKVWLSAHER